MTRTTRCLRNLSRLAFAMESSASTSAASSSSFLASSFSETSRLFQRATRAGTVAGATRVPSSSSIATASRAAEHKHKDGKEDDDVQTIAVTFTEKTGEEITVRAKVGESLMEAAHENDVELEGRIFVLLFS